MRLVQGGEQIQFEAAATFLIIFGAHMNLILYQSEGSCPHETVVWVPQLCGL